MQAVLPVADVSAEAQERQEAGQARQTHGQVGFMLPEHCQQQHILMWGPQSQAATLRPVPAALI